MGSFFCQWESLLSERSSHEFQRRADYLSMISPATVKLTSRYSGGCPERFLAGNGHFGTEHVVQLIHNVRHRWSRNLHFSVRFDWFGGHKKRSKHWRIIKFANNIVGAFRLELEERYLMCFRFHCCCIGKVHYMSGKVHKLLIINSLNAKKMRGIFCL